MSKYPSRAVPAASAASGVSKGVARLGLAALLTLLLASFGVLIVAAASAGPPEAAEASER